MISTCYRLNLFNYPQEAKNIKIGCNRKRGRPRLTASALKFQTENAINEEYIYSDTDSEPETPKPRVAKRKKAIEEQEEEYDLFASAPTSSASVPCTSSSLQSDDEDSDALPPAITPAKKKANSILKPSQPKSNSKKSSQPSQPKSKRSNLPRRCNTSK